MHNVDTKTIDNVDTKTIDNTKPLLILNIICIPMQRT